MADNRQRQLKAGDVLFAQGETPEGIYMLESGTLEVLSAPDEYNGLDRSIVISKGQRTGLLRAKVFVLGMSEQLVNPYRKSVRAVEDSTLTRYPLVNGGIRAMAASDQKMAISVLKHLSHATAMLSSNAGKSGKLYQTAYMMADNTAIMYRSMSETNTVDSLHSRAESIYNKFKAGGGREPAQFDARFMVVDNSQFLKKRYDLPGVPIDSDGSGRVNEFLERLLQVDSSLLQKVIKSDPSLAVSAYDILFEECMKTLDRNAAIAQGVNDALTVLFGSAQSWGSYLTDSRGLDEWKRSGKLSQDFLHGFLSLISKLNTVYEEMSGMKITAAFPVIRKIHELYSNARSGKEPAEQAAGAKQEAPAVVSSGAMDKSIHQIFEFAVVDKEQQGRFIKLLNEFKSMKDPFSTEIDGRKVRRHITKMYWDIYKQAFLRSKKESAVPRPVQLMIRFGFMDETMLEPAQVEELNELIRLQETSREIPVLYESEFLSMVMEGRMEPSINEMGLTYEEFLREQDKVSTKKKDKGEKTLDEHVNMVLYEIEQRVASTAAVCSGSTATAFPILTSLAVKGSLKSLYSDKKKIEDLVQEIREIDYSVFYRETVLKLGEAREIIMEEIIPNLILIPICGAKSLLWQELTGTNRRSRGRIVVPIFFMGDIKRRLIHTFACFRWELNRSLKGAMWADPIEGGVTGEYFDYVNTFKKMSKLSQEAKEKIAERFKAFRTNRDRFADDYIQWILYEREGIMRQNGVVREMFFKHIPFRKDVREKLGAMPAFAHAANRYRNIQAKTIAAYERRFKKYQDAGGAYPEEIRKYFEFLAL
ncbi:MAG: cyclic nucleotide-binding domain-containing protein [Spirochaetes bacterium]|nr:cyclic nucleotide-binding domain-containing protein [Spirochaetota bacterium]